MNRAEIKAAAKQQIKGNIGVLFVITLLVGLVSGAVNIIPGIGSIISVVIVAPALSLGIVNIYLALASTGKKPEIGDAFAHFKEFWGAFKVQFLVSLFTSLWSLLFVIPGIVKTFSYSMSMYVLAENPGIGAREAITRSRQMMNGHKMELFVLYLSFIGWFILGTITCGIAYIYILPYMSTTVANFYNKIKPAPEVVEEITDANAEDNTEFAE